MVSLSEVIVLIRLALFTLFLDQRTLMPSTPSLALNRSSQVSVSWKTPSVIFLTRILARD